MLQVSELTLHSRLDIICFQNIKRSMKVSFKIPKSDKWKNSTHDVLLQNKSYFNI